MTVRDVDGRVLNDDTRARGDDVAVGEEQLAAAAHGDRIAVDIDVAIVELQGAATLANEWIHGATSRARRVAGG